MTDKLGPPNKWAGFTTNDVKSADEFAAKLSDLYQQGYTGPVVVVQATSHSGEWVAVAGYTQGSTASVPSSPKLSQMITSGYTYKGGKK
jgi:hypothetical protein